MKKKENKMTYAIIGLGRFGMALACSLAQNGADLIALDYNEEKVREIREYTENAYVVKNLDRKSLEEAGVKNADVAVVCIGEKVDTSILVTLDLVNLGVGHIIAKAASAEHGQVLAKLGAEVVFPERDMAVRLAHRLETARVLDFIQLSERLNISKIIVPESMVGKTVLQAALRAHFGVNIIAIENKGKLIDHIRPDYEFCSGDILYVSGSKEGLEHLSRED